jgi:hypothetical protein
MSEGISRRVREFLLAYIDSFGLLEVLLTLAEAPRNAFTPEQVSDHLRTSPMSARDRMRLLKERALVEGLPDGSFRFAAGTELAAAVREVSDAYRERRVSVVPLIDSCPSGSMRGPIAR